jgi:hypothetical protein
MNVLSYECAKWGTDWLILGLKEYLGFCMAPIFLRLRFVRQSMPVSMRILVIGSSVYQYIRVRMYTSAG